MTQTLALFNGTVSEFDTAGGVGLIDADNGDIVFFNATNLHAGHVSRFNVGSRVEFASHEERFGPHADFVRLGRQDALHRSQSHR